MFKYLLALIMALFFTGCFPNTYYSTTDDYVIGLRWYDRGNYQNALQYWEPLVEKGDCDAKMQVGKMYFAGEGIDQNLEKAIELWKKAANGNQQKAQALLGDLYNPNDNGFIFCKTCDKDVVQAYVWYRLFEKSAKYEGERKYASHIIPLITKTMTDEQIRKGDQLVQQWKPTPKDCGARNLW